MRIVGGQFRGRPLAAPGESIKFRIDNTLWFLADIVEIGSKQANGPGLVHRVGGLPNTDGSADSGPDERPSSESSPRSRL